MGQRSSRITPPRLVALATLVTLALLALSTGVEAAPASATIVRKRHAVALATGTFVGQPLTVTNAVVDGDVVTFDGSSGDEWSGDLTGTTTYAGHGTLNLTTGETRMVLHETFTGTVAGFGTGQIHFVEYLQSGPSNLGQVDCVITGGTGELRGIAGALEFKATQVIDPDPYGNGITSGGYSGFLYR